MRKLAVILVLCALAPLAAHAKVLTIALDMSGSNPLITDERFAAVAAAHIAALIAAMEFGDEVRIRTLGERGLANIGGKTVVLDKGTRPDRVAAAVAELIRSLPQRDIEGQPSTNLIAFFEFTDFACEQDSALIVLTDGIESSTYINGSDLLAGRALPQAEENVLAGCAVTLFGVGNIVGGSLPPAQVKIVRAAWQVWMERAGADPFDVVINP